MEHTFAKRDDDLSVCTVCKGGEGSLTRDCPGVTMSGDTQDAVYAGLIDYVNGQWVPGFRQIHAGLMQVKYVVLEEHTLGYMFDEQPTYLHLLAGSVLRGGHDPLKGSVYVIYSEKLRAATKADFEFFRVMLPSDFANNV